MEHPRASTLPRTGYITAEAFDNNTARLAIVGDDPMLLAAQDAKNVSRVNKAASIARLPALERITQFNVNWNIVAWPGAAPMLHRAKRQYSSSH